MDSMPLDWVSWITSGESIWTSMTSSASCEALEWALVKRHGKKVAADLSVMGDTSPFMGVGARRSPYR